MIPYGKQNINQADIDAVVDTLRSDWLTQGPTVERFEQALCDYTGGAHAVAVNSATSALHIACLAMGLGKGDILWTTPNTFVASANCALYCGAEVDFVDIDPQTYNMSIDALEQKLISAKAQNRLPKIVVPVHFAGQSCDMAAIHRLSQQYGFAIIEDASHAIGGHYRDEPVGNCRYSDITVFSFHPVKIITTGEGGAAMTNDAQLAQHMWRLRSHGITRDETQFEQPADGDWSYQQIELGFNYRITDIQCALGLSQLQRLDDFIQRRHELVQRYHELLADCAVSTPVCQSWAKSSWHLYVITLQQQDMNYRKQVFQRLRKAGIGVNVHYIPVHTQPYYQAMGHQPGDCPQAMQYYRRCLSLPMHPGLDSTQQQYICNTLQHVLEGALHDI